MQNYREVEADYRRRTGVYPGFHIVAARRSFAENHPQAVLAVYEALQQSYETWTTKVKKFGEASPWAIDEYEAMLRDMPQDVVPFGLESQAHRRMVATICEEQYAQKLVEKAVPAGQVFAEFEALRHRVR